jgi:hypothetical protein
MSYTITDTLSNCFGTSEVSLTVYAFTENQFGGRAPEQYTIPPLAEAVASATADGTGKFAITVPVESSYHLAAHSGLNATTYYWNYSHEVDNSGSLVIDTTTGAHLIAGVQTLPTVATGANNGTTPPTPTLTTGSTDQRGQVKFGTGSSATAGAQVVITFTKAYTSAPLTVELTGTNAATAALVLYATVTTTTLTINTQAIPTSSQGATTFVVDYFVEQ